VNNVNKVRKQLQSEINVIVMLTVVLQINQLDQIIKCSKAEGTQGSFKNFEGVIWKHVPRKARHQPIKNTGRWENCSLSLMMEIMMQAKFMKRLVVFAHTWFIQLFQKKIQGLFKDFVAFFKDLYRTVRSIIMVLKHDIYATCLIYHINNCAVVNVYNNTSPHNTSSDIVHSNILQNNIRLPHSTHCYLIF